MRIRFNILLSAIAFLSGCATAPVELSLSNDSAAAVREATVFVVAQQQELYADVLGFEIGKSVWLVGDAADLSAVKSGYLNAKTYVQMRETVAPLRKAASDIDFNESFYSSVRKSEVFLGADKVRRIKKLESTEDLQKLVVAASPGPVVVIEPTYMLDIRYRVFMLRARVRIWEKDRNGPPHTIFTTYYSYPVSHSKPMFVTPEAAAENIALWMTDNAKAYRTAYAESLVETINMLEIAVLEHPSNLLETGDRTMEYVDHARRKHPILKEIAKVLHENEGRAIVLTEDGDYFSVPTGPTYRSMGMGAKSVAQGRGRIFFYQTNKGVTGYPCTVYLNGKALGRTYVETFFYVDLKPGEYTFSVRYEEDGPGAAIARSQIDGIKPVKLTVAEGQKHFLRFDGYRGVFTPDDGLKVSLTPSAEAEIDSLWLTNRE